MGKEDNIEKGLIVDNFLILTNELEEPENSKSADETKEAT